MQLFRNNIFQRLVNIAFKREDDKFLGRLTKYYTKEIKTLNNETNDFESFINYLEILKKAIAELEENQEDERVVNYVRLLRGLVLRDVFADDAIQDLEIVNDLCRACTELFKPISKPVKKIKTGKKNLILRERRFCC